jgi:aspartyl-tRNA(Asn)/glutamyl-tRNA(Gln) amidotransferase subunit C
MGRGSLALGLLGQVQRSNDVRADHRRAPSVRASGRGPCVTRVASRGGVERSVGLRRDPRRPIGRADLVVRPGPPTPEAMHTAHQIRRVAVRQATESQVGRPGAARASRIDAQRASGAGETGARDAALRRVRPSSSAIIGRMATLSRADVEHVAHLARLGLTDEELARLEGQLNHILDQYAVLASLDTTSIPPTAQTIELENILRDDVATPSLTVDEALANAPERDGDLFVVPAILGGS